ncbi:MAG: NAD-dependent epimerase/dehydratase family protein, partial [Methanobacteriota archaeon]
MEFALRCDHIRIREDMTHALLPGGNGFRCDHESRLPLHSLSRQSRAVNGGRGMERVLITGGNGFIGSHLAERLVDRGDAVTLFDNHFDSNSRHLSCAKIRGDVRHYRTIREAVSRQDVVFHFAAVSRVAWGQTDPYNCWRTNQLGTVNVLEACRKAESNPILFYASSREVYGEPRYLPVDEGHPKMPLSVYGMTKLCAERACSSYADPSLSGHTIKPVIFRFSNVYGSE